VIASGSVDALMQRCNNDSLNLLVVGHDSLMALACGIVVVDIPPGQKLQQIVELLSKIRISIGIGL